MDFGTLSSSQSKEQTVKLKAARGGAYTQPASAEVNGGIEASASPVTPLLREPKLQIALEADRSVVVTRPLSGAITVGNTGDAAKATALAGEPLGKADAALIRTQTGFAIGGVAPVGHVNPIVAFIDPRLMDFTDIWAAAGTPHHVFRSAPAELAKISDSQASDFTT